MWFKFWKKITLNIHAFFYKQHFFLSNARLKLAKNQTNAKQHPDAELFQFGSYLHSSAMLLSKNNRTYSKKQAKEQHVSVFGRLHD